MQISSHDIHIWIEELALTPTLERERLLLLSTDEQARAMRLQFPIHRQYFIAARSLLRIILSTYLNMKPQDIMFAYDPNKKPYLQSFPHLQFNLSHSKNKALYAFTMDHAIGVDIEKIKDDYHPTIAQRYFSTQENHDLLNLPPAEQITGFYKLWAHKEALIKASEISFAIRPSTFSISMAHDYQRVRINEQEWSFVSIPLPGYQAALATNQIVKNLCFWKYFNQVPQQLRVLPIS